MSEYCIVNSSITLNMLKKLKECEGNNAYVCILSSVCHSHGIVFNAALSQSK